MADGVKNHKVVLGTMQFGQPADPNSNDARVVDAKEVEQILLKFSRGSCDRAGVVELDTARLYNGGNTEILLGEVLNSSTTLCEWKIELSSKAYPLSSHGKSFRGESLRLQLEETLSALKVDQLDIFYLHWPDRENNCLDETLRSVHTLFKEGKFRRFGLSNYAAWEVADIVGRCRAQGYVEPQVYQGMYCALNRTAESELLPCLAYYGITFYAYNPLAGGLLTGRYLDFNDDPQTGRFSSATIWGQNYRLRYWQQAVFEGLKELNERCREAGDLSLAEAALRWLRYHSALRETDAVILGVSSLAHLDANLAALACSDPLPAAVLEGFELLWEKARPHAQTYWR